MICWIWLSDLRRRTFFPREDFFKRDGLIGEGVCNRSRLGCQVKMSKEIDGLVVKLPSMTRNLQSSDFSKKG